MAEIRVNATGAVKLYDNDDSHFVGLQAGSVSSNVTFTLPTADGSNGQFLKTDGSGALSFGSVSSSGAYDLNGGELVLDADADTSITADTDDQIDIRIAGADDFQFTANTFTAQSGSTIAAQALTATTVVGSGAAQFATAGIGAAKDLGVGLHIKSADSGSTVASGADELVVEGSGDTGLSILSGTDANGSIMFGDSADNDGGRIQYNPNNDRMMFSTNGSEIFRFDSDGNALFNTTNASTSTDPGVVIPSSQPSVLINNSGSSAGTSLILIRSSVTNADETKFEVVNNGDVKSRTNSYGAFSDERIKEQITDAPSQWTDIKNVKVKNFKFKSESLSDENNPKMLGVVAQELEASNMNGLVEDEVLYTATDLEVINKDKNVGDIKSYKTVKYSILYMKAIKALQEAMAKIESLEARVTTLEG